MAFRSRGPSVEGTRNVGHHGDQLWSPGVAYLIFGEEFSPRIWVMEDLSIYRPINLEKALLLNSREEH